MRPNEPSVTPRRPRRFWRRWLIAAALLAALPVLAFAALPWVLDLKPGQDWLMTRASRALSPGALRTGHVSFSWFGPTRITDLVLIDRDGVRVVEAPVGTWDRNLWQALFDGPRLGTLALDRVVLNIERSRDGKINLYETLRPVL